MKFAEIVKFEVEQQLRRPATAVYIVVLAGLTLLLNFGMAEGPRHMNSPLTITSVSALMGLAGMLITAALFTDAATRDVATGMHPLFYTEPVSKAQYLGGRFTGALIVNAVISLAIPLGQLLALKVPPIEGPETYLPFQAATYVQPFLLVTLPNVLVTAVILFTIAALTRRALPAYIIAIAMGMSYLFAMELINLLDNGRVIAAMADPFGMIALREHIKLWTPAERNAWQIGVPRLMLANRLLWIGFAAVIFAMLHRRFELALPAAGRWRWMKRSRVVDEFAERMPSAAEQVATPATREFGARTTIRQALAVARLALRDILVSRLFLGIAAAGLVLVFTYGWEVGAHVFETTTWPVTHLIAATTLGVPVSFVFAALIAIYAGELAWRDRDLRMSMITGAAPVAEGVSLAGSFLALLGMIVVLQGVMMAAGMLLQTIQGYYVYEPLLYVKILFGFTLVDYLLFAVLAMAVHVIVDNKSVGHVIVVLIFATTVFGSAIGLRHHLLLYGTDPGWVYSDMNGFGPFVKGFVWFKLYWAAWALLLAVIASLFWVRGPERGLKRRMSLARLRFRGSLMKATAVAALLIVSLGGFVFYNTNVLNDYRGSGDAELRSAEYEQLYKHLQDAPQPQLVSDDLRVEIYPERRAVEISGTYTLVNETAAPIDSLHVTVPRPLTVRSATLDRASTVVLDDDRHRFRIYRLTSALQPGDTLRLTFDVAFTPRGFPNSGINTSVAENGTYFDRRWLPYVGYQPALELTRIKGRIERGLAEHRIAALEDSANRGRRSDVRNEDVVQTETIVGTADDQLAITPGTLVKEWEEKGRRHYQYRTETPLTHGTPFLSARYAVRESKWNDVRLRVLYHPTHTVNIDRLMRAMKASLEYYSANFGPYPFKELRVVEFPRYATFARAHPHTIAFSEGGAFLTRSEEGDVDRPFFVAAHETAHQWWGVEVTPARVRGGALVSETLAQYSSMMVLEKTYGVEHARKFFDFCMQYYLNGRAAAARSETPLLTVGAQNWLYYYKGAVAMYTLREQLGETAVNTALRRYLDKQRNAGPPYPTSLDLYAELKAVTPDSLQYLLSDLLERVVMTEVSTDSAKVRRTSGGQYEVTMFVKAGKVQLDSTGAETAVRMNDLVEIGVFATAKEGASRGEVLYLRQHRVKSGAQTITVTVPTLPSEAGIDPLGKVIQRNTRDNVVAVGQFL